MSDNDALTEQAVEVLIEDVAERLSDSLTMLGVDPDYRPGHGGRSTAEVLAAIAVKGVAARVEQGVRRQIAADLMECAAKADASRRTTFFESSQTRLAHMAETYRIAAQVARGGSDVG